MKILLLSAAFAASWAYASPMAHGRWSSRIIGFALFCVTAATIGHALSIAASQ
jgi:hypothetical protein